jgi:hypothetical protein
MLKDYFVLRREEGRFVQSDLPLYYVRHFCSNLFIPRALVIICASRISLDVRSFRRPF